MTSMIPELKPLADSDTAGCESKAYESEALFYLMFTAWSCRADFSIMFETSTALTGFSLDFKNEIPWFSLTFPGYVGKSRLCRGIFSQSQTRCSLLHT